MTPSYTYVTQQARLVIASWLLCSVAHRHVFGVHSDKNLKF